MRRKQSFLASFVTLKMPADSIPTVKEVEDFIKKSPQGVSIQDVAREFKISRYESVYLLGQLIGAGKIGVRQIGPVKLHYHIEK